MEELFSCCFELCDGLCETQCCKDFFDCLTKKSWETPERARRCLGLCLIIVLLMVHYAFIVGATLNFNQVQLLEHFHSDLQKAPFIDIQVSPAQCPEGYEALSNYLVFSTQPGCFCPTENTLAPGQCPQESTQCTTQPAQEELVFQKWLFGSESLMMCGKRSNVTFYQMMKKEIYSPEDCLTSNFKLCESATQFFCVVPNEPCPIRDVGLSQVDSSYIPVRENLPLYVSRQAGEMPVVDFRVIFGNSPCLGSNASHSILEKGYLLNNVNIDECFEDQRFRKVSTLYESDYLKLNDPENVILSTRLLYPFNLTNQYNLILRPNYPYGTKEQQKEGHKEVDNLESFKSYLLAMGMAYLVLLTLCLIHEITECLVELFQMEKNLANIINHFVIRWIALGVLLYFSFGAVQSMNRIEELQIVGIYAADEQESYEGLKENLSDLSVMNYIIIGAEGLMLLILLVQFLRRRLKLMRNKDGGL